MTKTIPLDLYEQQIFAERESITLDWLTRRTYRGAERLRMLAYCDAVAAHHVREAFKDMEWADEFGISILYTMSTRKYRPYFWQIIGVVLEWLDNLDRARTKGRIDSAIPCNFLRKVASANSNLTPGERQFLAKRLMEYELFGLLADHGILEGIPDLFEIVTTLPDGSKQTQEAALVNGYKRIVVYNLLRLQAIKAAKEKKEEPEPATAA